MKPNLYLPPTTSTIALETSLKLMLVLSFISFLALPVKTAVAADSDCFRCSTEGGNVCCST